MAGQRFGRLFVLGRSDYRRPGRSPGAFWDCRCDCGGMTVVLGASLRGGLTQSCKCLHDTFAVTHGATHTSEYKAWESAKARCFQPNHHGFKNYGGRGITMCEEWRNDFPAFLAHVGPRPHPTYSIDRINNNGNYEPGNVRWATKTQQIHNRRRYPSGRRRARVAL